MTDYEKALCLITRLELIQIKAISLTPEKMLEEFGADEIGFFYDKICGGINT